VAIPDIFDGDENAERLARYFKEIYEYLVEEGVPADRLPSPWHVLSRAVGCVDHERLREWLDAYAAVEADAEEQDGEDPQGPAQKKRAPRHRPSYLRALDKGGEAPKPDPES